MQIPVYFVLWEANSNSHESTNQKPTDFSKPDKLGLLYKNLKTQKNWNQKKPFTWAYSNCLQSWHGIQQAYCSP